MAVQENQVIFPTAGLKMLQNSIVGYAILLQGFETPFRRLAQFSAEQPGDPTCGTVKVHSLE